MRQPLDKALRKKLEETVIKARDIVEAAVKESLQRLGVAESQAPSYLKDNEKVLRNKLRAHARQLGDRLSDGKQEITRLANEMAYEHWHRMLFARFLEQSNLLMYDAQTPVTLEECFELAEEEEDCKDGWELASRLAQKMLPQIFRADSPVFEVKLSMNRIDELESLISKLDTQTYQAQDSLGWCYQFWQTKKKEEVNKSGVRIGAQELSPVTQLFTEPYMVSFLLDNALGAWWANKLLSKDDLIRANSEQELRDLASIHGVPLEYLRFTQDEFGNNIGWKPAAGGFEKWPEHLGELKVLDPCCGSGHFLVAIFLMLVPMRMKLEGLTEKEAVDAVLRDNIHGLELDQRCVELAAFALALEAWRYPNAGGYRVLPELQLACSGMSIAEAQKEWKDLTKGDEALTDAIAWMQYNFKDAPTLGSLIDPIRALEKDQTPPWLLLQNAMNHKIDASNEAKATAQGLAKASSILSTKFEWIATNVPYLGDINQDEKLQKHIKRNYRAGKKDLANAFTLRCAEMLTDIGICSLVLPQNWMFLKTYQTFREQILNKHRFSLIARLGSGAFDTISGEVVKAILWSFQKVQLQDNEFVALDVSESKGAVGKSCSLIASALTYLNQDDQLANPRAALILSELNHDQESLSKYCIPHYGSKPGQTDRVKRYFWELNKITSDWMLLESTPQESMTLSGKSNICYSLEAMKYRQIREFGIRGADAWGSKGVIAARTSKLNAVSYLGKVFDDNCYALIPKNAGDLAAIWLFLTSDLYNIEVRKVNQKLAVDTQSMVNVPFDIEYWRQLASSFYPNGLPTYYSNDARQWLFHGHPCESVVWCEESKTTAISQLRQDDTVLQVTVARLLGYHWPAELDTEMELAPEMREVIKRNADFADLVDDDGIVCIPAVRGEKSAAKRLEAMLIKAYGDAWDSSVETNLLKAVKAKDLESWLRDKFFEQHCKLFQHRPFIWHIWDGLKDGFSALVNYHQLDYKGLERLIYTYLDDWISNQKRQLAEGTDGADIRLTAAENLKIQLEAILAGEEGLDIFVRWKPLEEQPIGWNPDLNDGVRLNIRPFMLAKDVCKKGAGVLRAKPNIHWKKDRGTDVESAPWYNLGLEYGGKQGDRINEHHLSLSVKREARMKLKEAD